MECMIITLEIPEEGPGGWALSPVSCPDRLLRPWFWKRGRQGKLSEAELGRLLGIESRFWTERFLKDHGVELEYTGQDLEYERQVHRELGFGRH